MKFKIGEEVVFNRPRIKRVPAGAIVVIHAIGPFPPGTFVVGHPRPTQANNDYLIEHERTIYAACEWQLCRKRDGGIPASVVAIFAEIWQTP